MKNGKLTPQRPAQKQKPLGIQKKMKPVPITDTDAQGCNKLRGKIAVRL